MLDLNALISDRCNSMDASGIRRIFELASRLENPIDLSIGQPDFDVPDPIKESAIDAIRKGYNTYTMTQGIDALQHAISERLHGELGWHPVNDEDLGLLVTSGTSGGLFLAALAMLQAGDEMVIPDPYFVIYPALAKMTGAKAVFCDTYPDFQMTAERLEPLLNERTKFVIVNSPGNPSGVAIGDRDYQAIIELCESRGVLVISDEIYDEFTYPEARRPDGRPPSAARFSRNVLLLRGFSKTYGMTGWRLGYATGPKMVVELMAKMQQYSFVCAPSMVQHAGVTALSVDVSEYVASYLKKRDRCLDALGDLCEIARPGGAFYVFPKVPEQLGMTGTEFVMKAVDRSVLIIPGGVFSNRDTHFRISYATTDEKLERGLSILRELLTSTGA